MENKKGSPNSIMSFIKYLLREELDIRHRILNMSLLIILVIQIPALILSIYVGSDALGVVVQAFILPIVGFVMWDLNMHPTSQRPLIAICSIINLIVFPFMYLLCGGRRTGMVLWITMGAIMIWILLEGYLCYVIFALDLLVFLTCMQVEYFHPEYVKFLATDKDERVDQIVAFLVVSVAFGTVFRYQTHVYEKQKQQLTEQERQLKESNISLEQASAAKSTFLANMSHEIRTPINAVLGMDEMILRECEDETILKYASDIDSAGHQLLSIVNDILDFSKIESGKMEIHLAEYELYSIMNDCYNMISMRAQKKNLAFIVENNPELPSFLIGDEVRVRQIIMNLLTNAVKYTKDGSVRLKFDFYNLDKDTIMLKVIVIDTGIGIAPENINKLFASFERIDELNNRTIEGTGLGLTITKRFVELMDGDIKVTSKLHIGSTFEVDIPQKVASHAEMGDFSERYNKRADSAVDKKNEDLFIAPDARVLVVDDVRMNLNVVRLLLKKTKIQVETALSGEECLDLVKLKHFDVILMDHMMPGMDGIKTFHEIRKIRNSLNDDTPVVALTANAIVGVEEFYIKEGFASYLSKPIKGIDLEKCLLQLIPKEKIQHEEASE